MGDPRKLFESRDIAAAALYAKRVADDLSDLYPVLVDAAGNLRVNMTVGTVTLNQTDSTINNAVGNPVNVSLTSTLVTVAPQAGTSLATTAVTITNGASNIINVNVATATLGTVTTSLSSTIVTVAPQAGNSLNVNVATATLGTVTISGNVNVATATLGTVTVALSSTVVTVANGAGVLNVNVATATLGTVVVSSASVTVSSISITASTSVTGTVSTSVTGTVATSTTLTSTFVTVGIVSGQTALAADVGATGANVLRTVIANNAGRTLTTGTGSFTSTNSAITLTPTNRAKVYAISLTTTAATELICVFNSGGVANGVELWRATLMAPAGASAGLNLAVTPPAYLFASRSGTAVSLSLNTSTLVHYSVSYFDEA